MDTPGGSADPIIRSYRPADRATVRAICCDTGELGAPMDAVFPDRELFADLITRYYTDYEPQSLWVAEADGAVGGYLTGCLDNRRYQHLMRLRVVPAALAGGLRRGVLFHPATLRLAGAAIRTLQLGGWTEPAGARRCSAHFHINLRAAWRGRRLGEALVRSFLAQARAQRAGVVCAAARGDNAAACRFFERLGFRELHRHPVAWPAGPSTYRRHDRILYAKTP